MCHRDRIADLGINTWLDKVQEVPHRPLVPTAVPTTLVARFRSLEGGLPNWTDEEVRELLVLERLELAQ